MRIAFVRSEISFSNSSTSGKAKPVSIEEGTDFITAPADTAKAI
jgi:hypothetical protein